MPERDNNTPEITILPEVKNFNPKSITEEIETEVQEELKAETISDESISEESSELTEEEKRKLLIKSLKESKKTYKPKKHFGVAYKKERKRKNKQAKKSRRANRN
jgi:hypothetical protein